MKIKDIFQISDVAHSIGGLTYFLDKNNCVITNKTKLKDAVILHMKREVDGEEGRARLKVKDQFKSLETPLLNWAFLNREVVGLTLNQAKETGTDLTIEKIGNRLSLRQK